MDKNRWGEPSPREDLELLRAEAEQKYLELSHKYTPEAVLKYIKTTKGISPHVVTEWFKNKRALNAGNCRTILTALKTSRPEDFPLIAASSSAVKTQPRRNDNDRSEGLPTQPRNVLDKPTPLPSNRSLKARGRIIVDNKAALEEIFARLKQKGYSAEQLAISSLEKPKGSLDPNELLIFDRLLKQFRDAWFTAESSNTPEQDLNALYNKGYLETQQRPDRTYYRIKP